MSFSNSCATTYYLLPLLGLAPVLRAEYRELSQGEPILSRRAYPAKASLLYVLSQGEPILPRRACCMFYLKASLSAVMSQGEPIGDLQKFSDRSQGEPIGVSHSRRAYPMYCLKASLSRS